MFGWLLNLVLPLYCARCGRTGAALCSDCADETLREMENCCVVCGNYQDGWRCSECEAETKEFGAGRMGGGDLWARGGRPWAHESAPRADGTFAFGFYDQPIGRMAENLKFKSARHLARPLAELLARGMEAAGLLEDLGRTGVEGALEGKGLAGVGPGGPNGGRVAIVPVPTARTRVRERGLDHTRLVAGELARIMGWSVPYLLGRQNDDLQRGKSKAERKKQSENMFTTGVDMDKVRHFDAVFLYDDITTTGATLAECAKLLRKNGAKNVHCIVLAKTR